MTYQETVEIMDMLDELSLWSRAVGRELYKADYDHKEHTYVNNNVEKAKERIFDHINGMKG